MASTLVNPLRAVIKIPPYAAGRSRQLVRQVVGHEVPEAVEKNNRDNGDAYDAGGDPAHQPVRRSHRFTGKSIHQDGPCGEVAYCRRPNLSSNSVAIAAGRVNTAA